MRILIINPNTTNEVTERIRTEAKRFESSDLVIDVIQANNGPSVIETYHDELVAAQAVIEEIGKVKDSYDTVILACFSDPGLHAARELFPIPIVGIAEASIMMASMNHGDFSIVATGPSSDIGVFKEIAGRYGLKERLASVKCLGVGVDGVSDDSIQDIISVVNTSCSDGAACAILGCGAFAGYAKEIENDVSIKVMDGICESIMFAKMQVHYQRILGGEIDG